MNRLMRFYGLKGGASEEEIWQASDRPGIERGVAHERSNAVSVTTKYKMTPDKIQILVDRHFPESKLKEVRELNSGTFNMAYHIKGTYLPSSGTVLKIGPAQGIDVPKHEEDILHTEVLAYQLLDETRVPVPKLYAYDYTHEDIPCDYFFMEFIEGEPWIDQYLSMGKVRPKLMRELGRYSAMIHSVEGGWFGDIAGDQAARFSSWGDAFMAMMESALEESRIRQFHLPCEEIRGAVSARRELLDAVGKPCLVNFDMWAGNVFLRKKACRVSGIIDFERCFFGDPYAGFVSAVLLIDDVEKEKEFIAGYNEASGKTLVFSRDNRIRMELYRLYFNVITTIETYRYRTVRGMLTRAYLLRDIKIRLKRLSNIGLVG